MLSLDTVSTLKSLLLSDSVTIKGSQLLGVNRILQDLMNEEQGLMLAARVKTAPVSAPVSPPPETPPSDPAPASS